MSISYNSKIYVENDLCLNIMDLLNNNMPRILFDNTYLESTFQNTPSVAIGQPHNEIGYPAIFIYPEKVDSINSINTYNLDAADINIMIDIIARDEYYNITSDFSKWVANIRFVLQGRMYLTGTATDGSITTMEVSGLANKYPDDHFNTMIITTTGGAGSGQELTVTDYNGATGIFTFATATALDGTTTYEITHNVNYWREELSGQPYLIDHKLSNTKYFRDVVIQSESGGYVNVASKASLTFKGVKLNDE